MKRILVTGGAGFIGGNFVRLMLLERNDIETLNLDLLTYAGNPETLADLAGNPRYRFAQGDIGDRELVTRLLREFQPDALVNFAAESHVDRSIDGPGVFIQTNVLGTFNLLNCARGYWNELDAARKAGFRFLHVSTDEVYGSLGAEGKFREDSPYAPNSPYSASKAASDHLVRAWHHTYGLPVLTTNCSNNYGPYQFPEKLIPLMIQNALAGKPLPIYGNGQNIRDWLYVRDHCTAIETVLHQGRPGEVYNIGGDSERTNLQVVDALCAILDERLPDSPQRPHARLKTFVADRPGHDLRYAIDASKIKTELGWRPEEDFESGLRKTVQWYLEHQDWVAHVMDGISMRQEMPFLEEMASHRGERLGRL